MNASVDLLLRLAAHEGQVIVGHEAVGRVEVLLRNGFVEIEELPRGRWRVVPTVAGRREAKDRPLPRYRSESYPHAPERKRRHAL